MFTGRCSVDEKELITSDKAMRALDEPRSESARETQGHLERTLTGPMLPVTRGWLEQLRALFQKTGMLQWLREESVRYDGLADRLRAEGFTIGRCDGFVPVQIEGTLPDGRPFYFRCRYTHCSLGVDGDPVAEPDRYVERDGWEDFEAGWLSAEEAERVFRELLAEVALAVPGARP